MSSSPSRLAPARRRARFLKLAAAGAAVAGFGALSMVVRGSHPGGAASIATTNGSGSLDVSSRIAQEAEERGSFFQSGSVAPAPSTSAPQASTQTS